MRTVDLHDGLAIAERLTRAMLDGVTEPPSTREYLDDDRVRSTTRAAMFCTALLVASTNAEIDPDHYNDADDETADDDYRATRYAMRIAATVARVSRSTDSRAQTAYIEAALDDVPDRLLAAVLIRLCDRAWHGLTFTAIAYSLEATVVLDDLVEQIRSAIDRDATARASNRRRLGPADIARANLIDWHEFWRRTEP